MLSVQELIIRVTAHVAGAIAPFRELQGTINSTFKQTAGMREFGQHALMMGGALMAAGGGVAYGLKRAVDAAAEIDAAMTHLDTNLDSGSAGLREHAEALDLARKASVQFNYAQKDIIDNLYRSISFTGDFNTGLAVTKASLALAKGNRGDAAAVGEQFAIIANDFVDKTKPIAAQIEHLANLTSYTVRHGAFTDINQLSESLKISIGSAKAAGLSYEDLLSTIQGFSRVGLAGSEAGSAIEESLQAFSKGKLQKELGASLAVTKSGGLDIIGTFVNLRKAVGAGTISVEMFKRSAAALGIRGERALGINVDDLVAFRKQLADPNLINGDAMRGAMTMMSAFNEQVGALGKRWDILLEHIGTPLIGPITKLGTLLAAVLDRVNAFAEAHPQIVKFAVTFAAIGSALAIVVGGAIALAGGLMIVGSYVGVTAGLALTIGEIGTAITFVSAAAVTWGGSFMRIADSIGTKLSSLWHAIEDGAVIAGAAVLGFVAPMYAATSAMAAWSATTAVARGAMAAWSVATDLATYKQIALTVASKAMALAQGVISAATGLWTGAQWALNAALTANPIGLAIAGVALLAGGIYEVYKHTQIFGEAWAALKTVFAPIAGWLKSGLIVPLGTALTAALAAVRAFAGRLYDAGANLMKQLVAGIESMAMAPVRAVEKMAASIRSYLPFSPAKEGPLRELGRVRIVETIAESIRPGPVAAALRRMAAAAALAVPLMFTPALSMGALSPRIALEAVTPALKMPGLAAKVTPTISAPNTAALLGAIEAITPAIKLSPKVAPVMAAARTAARVASAPDMPGARSREMESSCAAERSAAPISMNVNVTFNVTAPADSPEFRDQLRKHGQEIAETLRRELEHAERRAY